MQKRGHNHLCHPDGYAERYQGMSVMFNNRPHTSNDLAALKQFCPGYAGDAYYVTKPAVTDGNLITASGFSAVDFAYEVIKKMGVMREATLEAWYNLNLTKKGEYYYALMESLGEGR